ncbi:RNA-directed DNA polymerase [Anoxybacterium hadale]|uniref:RNA-directed DNA polymerase n=1 Tax=Anoxybacterium hadale TaxID=3408580 RepID=A0ACD1AF51_9FIRM|nr:RNA-directed DNA polymerase [Clostridiales bacterium]
MDKEKYISELRIQLESMEQSQKDIDSCISYAIRLIDSSLPVIFDKRHLSLLLGIELEELTTILATLEENYYNEMSIPKKSEGYRTLNVPAMKLKMIQRWILDNILEHIPVSDHVTGFCKERSIVTNAKKHIGKQCVISFDIKDFFPTIDIESIFMVFYYYGYTKEISYALARLCTYDGYLPQGSPASPYISNILCLKLDKRLSLLAEKYVADYTRYADDITFSGNYGLSNIINIVKNIIQEEGFTVNERKIRVKYKHQRQEVTGLIVSDNKVSVSKLYKRKLWQEIYYCQKYGVSSHLEHINCKKSFFKEHIYGKVYFIYMVEPEEGRKLLIALDKIAWDY